jgi:hypothetical protein
MGHQHWGRAVLATVLSAATVACAPGVEDGPQRGSQLEPTFRPARDKAAREQAQDSDRDRQPPAARRARARSPEPGQDASSPAPSATAPATDAAPSSTAAAARVRDPSGDVSGLGGAPSYVDLTGATLALDDDRVRLVVETGGTLPTRQEGDRTMNVVGFVDGDLDGTVDHEVWATLADDGWGSSSRHPDGARFGEESGVEVRVSGSTLTLVFARGLIGGDSVFQWSAAAEYGTLEQVASGTTARDHAPDSGAVAFPG